MYFILFLHFYNKFLSCALRVHTLSIRSHELNGNFISSICICFAFNMLVQQCIGASKNCPKRLSIQGVANVLTWQQHVVAICCIAISMHLALQWQAAVTPAAKAVKRRRLAILYTQMYKSSFLFLLFFNQTHHICKQAAPNANSKTAKWSLSPVTARSLCCWMENSQEPSPLTPPPTPPPTSMASNSNSNFLYNNNYHCPLTDEPRRCWAGVLKG